MADGPITRAAIVSPPLAMLPNPPPGTRLGPGLPSHDSYESILLCTRVHHPAARTATRIASRTRAYASSPSLCAGKKPSIVSPCMRPYAYAAYYNPAGLPIRFCHHTRAYPSHVRCNPVGPRDAHPFIHPSLGLGVLPMPNNMVLPHLPLWQVVPVHPGVIEVDSVDCHSRQQLAVSMRMNPPSVPLVSGLGPRLASVAVRNRDSTCMTCGRGHARLARSLSV